MKNRKGFILIGVLFVFLFLMIIVPVMVKWVENDTKISVKDQKSTLAFNLAEAAVDRGYWKVKSSTGTFATVSFGGTLSGYNFDATYTEISGGSYRVKIISGPGLDQITIFGEGRDSRNKETRAIKAVYTNTSVPGAILSAGNLTATSESTVHWGPIMAKGDISISTGTDRYGNNLRTYYPRKLSMHTVKPLDPTGDTNPPNTDSLEWWSNYNVPDLPVFDFVTMKASAAATGTLDCQDVYTTYSTYISTTYAPSPASCTYVKNGSNKSCTCTCDTSGNPTSCSGKCTCGCAPTYTTMIATHTTTTPIMQCCSSTVYGGPVTCAYGGSDGCVNCTVTDIFHQTTLRDKNYTWYWDHNVTWGGYIGIMGTVVVMGNMSLLGDKDDRYCRSDDTTNSLPANPGCTVAVPPNAWKEYQKFDTAATNEYPADTGFRSNALTYKIGTSATESSGSGGDLGVYGFVYVDGNFARAGASDIYGSIWVRGNVSGTGNTMIFYNSKLNVPTLNVVLVNDSWQEQKPSSQAWP